MPTRTAVRSATPLLALVAAALLKGASACVFAVDLGSENLKVSLVKPGRTPIAIVSNEFSKRKSPALVGFSPQGDLLLGEDANAVATRYPTRVYARARDMLGLKHDDEAVARIVREHRLPYTIVPDPDGRGTAAFQTESGDTLLVEEVVAQLLKYADRISEAQAGTECKDAVLIVPGHWGTSQRLAALDAARLADLNTLAMVSDHASAGLQYGIDKDFANATQNVIFYDMGSNGVKASYTKFSTFKTKEFGKSKDNGQLEVKDVRWLDGIGGATLDMVLVEHFMKEFEAKHGTDLTKVPRAVAKLRKACKKTKEILSANTEAPVSVEGLHNDIDFRSSIKRDAFYALAGDFFERAAAPLRDLVAAHGGGSDNVAVVELLGGGSRVPGLLSELEKAFDGAKRDPKGPPVLGRHLDSDEAVALGAALHAANMSTSFRMRKFGFSDTAPFEVQLTSDVEPVMKKSDDSDAAPSNADGTWTKTALAAFKRLPARKVVTFNDVTVDKISLLMHYNKAAEQLPAGVEPGLKNSSAFGGVDIARVTVSDIEKLTASTDKYNVTSKPKVTVTLHFDTSGMFYVEKAEASFDTEYIAKVRVPIKRNETEKVTAEGGDGDAAAAEGSDGDAETSTTDGGDDDDDAGTEDGGEAADEDTAARRRLLENVDATADADADATADGNATDAGGDANATKGKAKDAKPKKPKKPPIEYETVEKLKTKVMRIPLEVSDMDYTYPVMNKEVFKAAKKRLHEIDVREAAKKKKEAAKNNLETFIFDARSKLSDDDVELVSTEEVREDVRAQLMDAEDWLYGDGDNAETEVYVEKLQGLKNLTDPIQHRARELTARPEAMKKAQEFIKETRAAIEKLPKSKPFLTAEEIKVAEDELDTYEKFLEENEEKQNALKPTDDPVLTSSMIVAAAKKVKKEMQNLKDRRPPPPPPKPKKKANATKTTNATNTTEETEVEDTPRTEPPDDPTVEAPPEDGEAPPPPPPEEGNGEASPDSTSTHDGDELRRK